jgi:hypothetical protein
MARRVTFEKVRDSTGAVIGIKQVDLGPVVPRDPSRKSPKNPKFTTIIHHKHRQLLPEWWLNNPNFTIESSFRKPEGPTKYLLSREATKAARWLVTEKGYSHKDAARKVVQTIRDKFPKMAEKWSKQMIGLEDRIVKNLRQGR